MTRCKDIRPLLEDHTTGLLAPDDAARVAAHTAACPSCDEALRAFAALPARRGRVPLPSPYAESILPRLRERLAAPRPTPWGAFALRAALPSLAAVFLAVLTLQLVPGHRGPDAAVLLEALPEEDLSAVADAHEAAALLTLPAESPETATPGIAEADLLEEIVGTEDLSDLASYLDADAALSSLGDEEQAELIAMLDHH